MPYPVSSYDISMCAAACMCRKQCTAAAAQHVAPQDLWVLSAELHELSEPCFALASLAEAGQAAVVLKGTLAEGAGFVLSHALTQQRPG